MNLNKNFTSGKSELSRADLESLPCPFCTKDVSDEEMQSIVDELEQEWCDNGDITKDRFDEKWWEILEHIVCKHGVPYYEDL